MTKGPPDWIDRILEWYCSDYYLEEIQGDLHEWFYRKQQKGVRFLSLRYLLAVVRYFSISRSKPFQKLIQNPYYLSMKNILKITLRNLRKDKLSGFTRMLNLVLGISVFLLTLVYARYELNYDRFHENGEKIYRLGQDHGGDKPWAAGPIGLGGYIVDNVSQVRHTTRFVPEGRIWIRKGEEKYYESGIYFTDTTTLKMFSFDMISGDPRTALSEPMSIVLTERMATKYFGEEDPMGQTLELLVDRGKSRVVTGVLREVPDQSHLQFDFLCPITSLGSEEYRRSWRNYFVYTYVQLDDATAIPDIGNILASEFRDQYNADPKDEFTVTFTPLHGIHLFADMEKDNADHGNAYHVYMLFSIGLFVLIISCINFINLTVIKGLDRAKEIGLRKTVGASRSQLIIQFMAENMVLLIFAGILSAGILAVFAPFFRQFSGLALPLNFLQDGEILLPLMLIILGLELISGIYPAVVLSKFKPAEIIKTGGALRLGKVSLTRQILIVTQFALSVILVIGSIMVYAQLSFMKNRDLGFEKDQVLLIKLNWALGQKIDVFKDQVGAMPGVRSVSISGSVPGYRMSMESVAVPGTPEGKTSRIEHADNDFLEVFNIDLISGQNFNDNPGYEAPEYLINETMARQVFPDRDAVGELLVWRDTGRVVGVVADFNFRSLHSSIEPLTIVRNLDGRWGYASIRFEADKTQDILSTIENVGREVYPDLPPVEAEFLDKRFEQLYIAESKLQDIVWAFCIITIVLTITGVFGIATYNAQKRAREMAIRKVLGGSLAEILKHLSRGFIYLLLWSLLIGLPGAYYLSQWWLQDFAYQIGINPIVFVVAAVVMLLLIAISSGYVTLKTARTNPADVLKNE